MRLIDADLLGLTDMEIIMCDGDYKEAFAVYNVTGKTPQTAQALAEKYGTEAKPADQLPAGVDTTFDVVIIVGTGE